MIPRLNISFSIKSMFNFFFGKKYISKKNEYLLNHARSGIILVLKILFPNGCKVGVMAYNCHTIANAVVNAGAMPCFIDVTSDLKIDMEHLMKQDIDVLILTNLFGIRNNVEQIRKAKPNLVIIVDNAHGYGLPIEGDYVVYSINQGKFPSIGEGGILIDNSKYSDLDEIDNSLMYENLLNNYNKLSSYTFVKSLKLFLMMFFKSLMYSPFVYSLLTKKLKKSKSQNIKKEEKLLKMCDGVSRLYNYYLPSINEQIKKQINNAQKLKKELIVQNKIESIWFGDNAFMLILKSDEIDKLKEYFLVKGIETETHFKNAIVWAKEFGYKEGSCPMTENLVNRLLMVPTYKN